MIPENLDSNYKEIIKEANKCIKCGLCRHACPIYEVMLNELYSPRAKNQLFAKHSSNDFNNDEKSIEILKKISYTCSLCNNCSKRCPSDVNLKIIFRNFRNYLVKTGNEPKEHKAMIENIRKFGNTYGEDIDEDNFYCC